MKGQDFGPFVHWQDFYHSDEESQVIFGLRDRGLLARKQSLPGVALRCRARRGRDGFLNRPERGE